MIHGKVLVVIFILILISPIFGIILANMTGYHEPLDVAAEMLGLKDMSRKINWTPFFNYSIPGLNPIIGYIMSGLIGVAIIYCIGYIVKIIKMRGKK